MKHREKKVTRKIRIGHVLVDKREGGKTDKSETDTLYVSPIVRVGEGQNKERMLTHPHPHPNSINFLSLF
jgi:hypothetical protein